MTKEGEDGGSLITKLKDIFSRTSGPDKRPSSDEKQAPANTINELQILVAHTDIVRIVLKLDESRFVYLVHFDLVWTLMCLFTGFIHLYYVWLLVVYII